MNPSLSLLKVNRVGWEIPMHYGMAIKVEIQPFLPDRGRRQDEWPER
jgi:hypothetical protein